MEGKIKIVIGTDGTVSFEVNGVTGTKCEDLTRVLTESLGTLQSQTLKEEYNSVQELPAWLEE